jgi:hypothetical protein
MRRFVLIAAIQGLATCATWYLYFLHSEDSDRRLGDLILVAGWILAAPLLWIPLLSGALGQLPALGVLLVGNAMLWSAVICWLLGRRDGRLTSSKTAGLQS